MECATLTFAQCIQNHQRVASSRTLNSHARDAKVLRERESEKTLQVLLTTRKIPLVLIGAKPSSLFRRTSTSSRNASQPHRKSHKTSPHNGAPSPWQDCRCFRTYNSGAIDPPGAGAVSLEDVDANKITEHALPIQGLPESVRTSVRFANFLLGLRKGGYATCEWIARSRHLGVG
jgi:hypothetical protein